MTRTIAIFTLMLWNLNLIHSQDIHHTLLDLTPSNKNAALVGNERGTTYFSLLHRNQNYTIVPNVFLRNSLVIDHNIKKYWGVGINLHHAQTGEVGIRYNSAQVILNRHIPVANNIYFSIGARLGLGSFKNYNQGKFQFESSILGLPNFEEFQNTNLLSYRAGGATTINYSKKNIKASIGYDIRYNWLSSLNKDNYISDNRWLKMYHLNIEQKVFPKTVMQFTTFYQTLHQAYELQLQTTLHTQLNNKNIGISYGLGWRYGESIQFILGMRYKEIQFMMGYDHNMSKLAQAARGVGALELGASFKFHRDQQHIKQLITLPKLSINNISVPVFEKPQFVNAKPLLNHDKNKSEKLLVKLNFEALKTPSDTVYIQTGTSDTLLIVNPNSTFELKVDPEAIINIKPHFHDSITLDLSAHPVRDNEVEISLKLSPRTFKFSPIYYDFDLSIINANQEHPLETVVAEMKNYPEMKISLKSYTDDRGSHDYNLSLSERRATAAKDYLMNRGIAGERIMTSFYGEKDPVIDCQQVLCNQSHHQLNRRTEILIVW